MIHIRRAHERGHARHGWLESFHAFSFADYHDPRFMGFRSLRVLNDDLVQPGKGFGTHSHQDMEIVTYVLDGALEHRDSMGTGSVIRPGDVQLMRAGTGVTHSEYNPSQEEVVHLLQIWILPEQRGLTPAYAQRHFSTVERGNVLRLVASRDGRDGSLLIRQDAAMYATRLGPRAAVSHTLEEGRHAWIHLARGQADLNGMHLTEGDGAAVTGEHQLTLTADGAAEALVFDLG